MVLTILIPACAIYRPLRALVTASHVDTMCRVILLTGSLVGYSYAIEFFTAWYSGNLYERAAYWQRAFGPYGWACGIMVLCNVVVPQLFWFRTFRTHLLWVLILVQFPNIGRWFERYVIVTGTLTRGFTPSAWALFHPTWVDICTLLGTFGLFASLFLLFIRFLPMICMFEVKADMAEMQREEAA